MIRLEIISRSQAQKRATNKIVAPVQLAELTFRRMLAPSALNCSGPGSDSKLSEVARVFWASGSMCTVKKLSNKPSIR